MVEVLWDSYQQLIITAFQTTMICWVSDDKQNRYKPEPHGHACLSLRPALRSPAVELQSVRHATRRQCVRTVHVPCVVLAVSDVINAHRLQLQHSGRHPRTLFGCR